MFRGHVLKELSAYLDNQLSRRTKEKVEKHLADCKNCREELSRLKQISEQLKAWQTPDLGADFDARVKHQIVLGELEKGEVKMNKKLTSIWIPSSALVVIVLVAVISLQTYVKRGLQGRIKNAGNGVADATQRLSFEGIQYQPYYVESNAKNKMVMSDSFSETGNYPVYDKTAIAPTGITGNFPQQSEFFEEEYSRLYENDYLQVAESPLSTFSIDVDTASYANVRRFLSSNQMPPEDAVRIEELINYFTYDYPQPEGSDPFSINTELSACPWNSNHKIALIGLQGKKMDLKNLPPSNLVFLIDVSGSMQDYNKLPLLKSAFRLLVNNLRPEDKISIVTYAGSSGVVLDSVSGSEKERIIQTIEGLNAGGGTAGAQGVVSAYEIAKKNLLKNGNNRVILATDGDFNIGVTSESELIRMIEERRDDGIFLTILGFGMGNYKDAKMEKMADKGNGTISYIDNIMEAKKVFVNQLTGTLFTIAKDVKIQVEFNPAKVKAYRLVGYENRKLENKDFNDDKKDAGEMGAGHTVTALYEIVPADSKEEFAKTDPLKYQNVTVKSSEELLTVKLRYKEPKEDTSKLLSRVVGAKEEKSSLSENLKFASSVAEFGMLLRHSQYKANASYQNVLDRAKASKGADMEGYRADFIRLVEIAQMLDKTK